MYPCGARASARTWSRKRREAEAADCQSGSTCAPLSAATGSLGPLCIEQPGKRQTASIAVTAYSLPQLGKRLKGCLFVCLLEGLMACLRTVKLLCFAAWASGAQASKGVLWFPPFIPASVEWLLPSALAKACTRSAPRLQLPIQPTGPPIYSALVSVSSSVFSSLLTDLSLFLLLPHLP
jgi:hypothetical protein